MNNLAIGDRVVDDSNYLGIDCYMMLRNRNGSLRRTHLFVKTYYPVDRCDLGPEGTWEKQRVALRCHWSPCLLFLRSSLRFVCAACETAQMLLDPRSVSNQVGLRTQIELQI